MIQFYSGGWVWGAFASSVSVVEGRTDRPGLHGSSAKHGVDRRAQQVDGSSDVENRLPLFYGVLQGFRIIGKTVLNAF